MILHKLYRIVPITCAILLLTACGSGSQSGGMQNYKDTKSMVIDILESEEAKKVIQKASEEGSGGGGGGIKMLSTPEGKQIQIAVKDVLTDPSYPKHLEKMMTDPKFAGEFAKAVSKDNKQLHKDLMKDPEYQTMLVEVMKNPEFEKILLETLKGTAYRKQAMMVFQESLQNPLFKVELMALMKKVMEEEAKPKKKEEGQ
ncbi:MAG: spore germination lipoprotein GerD [Paenibacillaceae bacterium]